MDIKQYVQHDATALADLLRGGETSKDELVALAREVCAIVNPAINAVIEIFDEPDCAERVDHPPFAGVPFLIKDLVLHTAHSPVEMGSRLAAGVRIPHDTDLMRRFRAAGLVTLGRTTTPEFGYAPTTETVLNGKTRNPWDLARSSGGSSGGSAAAVAAGIVPLAHANDGGGSICIPASCCGLVGLKPTRGRTPTGPDAHDPLCSLGIEFAVTRSVRDTAALLDSVQGPGLGDGYVIPAPRRSYASEVQIPCEKLRIAWTDTSFDGVAVTGEIARALEATVKLCTDLGHSLQPARPSFSYAEFMDATHTIWTAFMAHSVEAVAAMTGRTPSADNLEATSLKCWEEGKRLRAQDLLHAMDINNAISRQVAGFFNDYDVLLTPTLAQLPLPLGEMDANDARLSARGWTDKVFSYAAFTGLFNTTGQPAISLPLQRTTGSLPIGMHFAARWGEEDRLIRLASQLEKAAPWPLPAAHLLGM